MRTAERQVKSGLNCRTAKSMHRNPGFTCRAASSAEAEQRSKRLPSGGCAPTRKFSFYAPRLNEPIEPMTGTTPRSPLPRACITSLEAFNSEKVRKRLGNPEVVTLEAAVDKALLSAFAYGTPAVQSGRHTRPRPPHDKGHASRPAPRPVGGPRRHDGEAEEVRHHLGVPADRGAEPHRSPDPQQPGLRVAKGPQGDPARQHGSKTASRKPIADNQTASSGNNSLHLCVCFRDRLLRPDNHRHLQSADPSVGEALSWKSEPFDGLWRPLD